MPMKPTQDINNLYEWGMPQYSNSRATTNGSSGHEVNKRYDNLDEGGVPQCRMMIKHNQIYPALYQLKGTNSCLNASKNVNPR